MFTKQKNIWRIAWCGAFNNMKYLITLVGLVLILESLPYVAFPEAMQEWLHRLTQMNPGALRLIGLIAMGAGLALCFITQRTDWIQ